MKGWRTNEERDHEIKQCSLLCFSCRQINFVLIAAGGAADAAAYCTEGRRIKTEV